MGTSIRFSTTVERGDDPAPVIVAALEAAERFTARAAIHPVAAARVAVVVEELLSNVLRHGIGKRAVTVHLELSSAVGEIHLDLADDAMPFDPTVWRDFGGPDPESGGGVGLALVKSWAIDAAYRRDGESNHLRLTLPAGD